MRIENAIKNIASVPVNKRQHYTGHDIVQKPKAVGNWFLV